MRINFEKKILLSVSVGSRRLIRLQKCLKGKDGMFLAFVGENNVAASIISLTVSKNVILRDIFNWFSNLRYIPAIKILRYVTLHSCN